MLWLEIQRLPHAADLPLPAYQTAGAAGLDLHAAVEGEVALEPGERRLIPTGIRLAIPEGYEGQIRPRSGLALQQGVTVLNAPGTIDADYRGEVGVILINLGRERVAITRGMRIAQLVLASAEQAKVREVEAVPGTERGAGGFGHTGTGLATPK